MKLAGLGLLLIVGACTVSSDARTTPAAVATQPWERDPYTQTAEIQIDGKPVGYLVEYQPIPTGVTVARDLPAGSYRIEGRDFEEVGFISPRGEFRRYVGTRSTSLGTWELDDGLLRFFGGGSRVRLAQLLPSEPKPAAPAPAPAAAEAKTDAPPKKE